MRLYWMICFMPDSTGYLTKTTFVLHKGKSEVSLVRELKYGRTNTYLIKGSGKYLLFDTDWAGTFSGFCRELKNQKVKPREIAYLMISHFHPDHMGIAQNLAELGIRIVVFDVQKEAVHHADAIFEKEKNNDFIPIKEDDIELVSINDSRDFLKKAGIFGEVIATPGHSEDSISLCLDEGICIVGDLNPLYELELHEGTVIAESWEKLFKHRPDVICYGHAKKAILHPEEGSFSSAEGFHTRANSEKESAVGTPGTELTGLVEVIMRYIDKGMNIEKIHKKTKADKVFIEDVMRMYLTHRNVSVQGILDRIEIKNK